MSGPTWGYSPPNYPFIQSFPAGRQAREQALAVLEDIKGTMLRALEAQGRREGHRAEVGQRRESSQMSFLVQISPEWGFVG